MNLLNVSYKQHVTLATRTIARQQIHAKHNPGKDNSNDNIYMYTMSVEDNVFCDVYL